MKLGILKTGAPPEGVDQFGDYPEMFRRLLGEDAYDYSVFAVDEGELPPAQDACQAYLITGSSSGVYDGTPWIGELTGFLREAKGRAALVGICFGHQVMAQAFGGRVIKSPKGWGLGEQEYRVLKREPWMDEAAWIDIPVSHQDQVFVQPPHSRVVGGNDFSPFGMLAYDDQPAISMQFHPEFEPAYAKALIESRFDRVPDPAAAIASLDAPDDRARVAGWIRTFLES